MKNKLVIALSLLGISSLSLGIALIVNSKSSSKVDAATKPANIDLNDTSENEIRNYYSYLNNLPDSERRGTNLLKNLKYIISTNPTYSDAVTYYSYAQVREIYNITDRQWSASPASGISGYNSSSNTITSYNYNEDPYLYYYYRSDNYTNPHRSSAQVTSKEGKVQTLLNQEHLWSVSHGFKNGSTISPNAGTDLHHLVAADVAGNKWGHSNYTYGYVQTEDSDWAVTRDNWDNGANAILGNKRGYKATVHTEDLSDTVFEPQDMDKGDVARALFYMAARYNNYADTSVSGTLEEPALSLIDYVGDESVTTVGSGTYGILSDLLEWHKNDAVTASTYEIHRNNLIYENFQHTRNPFIDFPEWVDYIWGDKATTGVASPLTDTINGYNTQEAPTQINLNVSSIEISSEGSYQAKVESVVPSNASKSVTWSSSNDAVASVNSYGTITGNSLGSAVITAASTLNPSVAASINVLVKEEAIKGLTLSNVSMNVLQGESSVIGVIYDPIDTTQKGVTWTSDNTSVATVDINGQVTGVAQGSAVITATSTVDPTLSFSCKVYVTLSNDVNYVYQKVTASSQLTDGKYLIVSDTNSCALNASLSRASIAETKNVASVSIKSNTIESNQTTDSYAFEINFTNGTIYSEQGYYIGSTSSTGQVATSETATLSNSLSVNPSTYIATIESKQFGGSKVRCYSGSIRYYTSGTPNVYLYKYTSVSDRQIEKSFDKISTLADITSGMYVLTASDSNGDVYAINSSFPNKQTTFVASQVNVVDNSISMTEAEEHIVFIENNNDGTVTVSGGEYFLSTPGSSLIGKKTSFSWTPSLVNDKGTFRFTGTSRVLAMNNSTHRFSYLTADYASARNIDLFKYNEVVVEGYTATDFASDMMNKIMCDASGSKAPGYASGYSWSTLKTKFNSLTSDEQDILLNASTSEFSSSIIERAMYRYDFMVSKYSELEDFINRNPSPKSHALNAFSNNNSMEPIILIISLLSITSLGVFIVIRKRKAN